MFTKSIIEDFKTYKFPSNICAAAFTLARALFSSLGQVTYNYLFEKWHHYIPIRCVDESLFYMNPFDWTHAFVFREIINRGVYEKVFAPEKDNIVVDVGAHIGAFSIRCARLVGSSGRVIAFEPNPESFYLLKKNIVLNRINNIFPINSALGEAIKSEYLTIPSMASALSSITCSRSANLIKINVVSLDAFFENKIPRVDFLKIDAEGSEMRIIEGAKKTITKNRMRIIMEVHNQSLLFKIVKFLAEKGYVNVLIDNLLYASNRSDDLRRLSKKKIPKESLFPLNY